MPAHQLFEIPLPAEEACQGNEAEAGEAGREGDTLRAADRRARLQLQAETCHGVPEGRQQGACVRFLPWTLHTVQGAGRGPLAAFRKRPGGVRQGGADAEP